MQAKVTDYNTLQLNTVFANFENHKNFSFSGNCKSSSNVKITITGSISKDVSCESGNYNTTIDLSPLEDGEYPVEISGISDSSLISSYHLVKDIIPPDVASLVVDDGRGSFELTKSPLITWNKVSDLYGSGFDRYEICLGTNPGSCNIQNWVSTSQLNFYQYLAASLVRDQIYYVSLRAFDKAQNVSKIVSSDGFYEFRKLNLNIPEDLGMSYIEGEFYNDGGTYYIGRNGEGSLTGVFLNYLGSFLVSNATSYNSAVVSKNSRYVMYFEESINPNETESLWVFDSITKQKYYLSSSYSEMYNMVFNNSQTKAYFNKIDNGKCGIWSFNLQNYSFIKVAEVSDNTTCPYDFSISPDDSKIIYIAQKNSSITPEAYVVSEDGSNDQKVSGSIVAGGQVWRVGITNTKAIIHGDLETDNKYELWSVNFDGTSKTKISGAMVSGGGVYIFNTKWVLSADNSKVIFIADKTVDNVDELWSVNLDGTGLTKLSGVLVSNGDVQSLYSQSNNTIFQADKDTDTVNEYYLAKNDGSSLFKLHPALSAGGTAKIYFPETTTSDRLITFVSTNGTAAKELYSIKTDGTDLKVISVALGANDSISDIVRSYINDWVIYSVYNSSTYIKKIYRCNSDGSNTILLNDNSSGSLELFGITRDDKSLIVTDFDEDNFSEKVYFLDSVNFNKVLNGYYPSHPDGVIDNMELLPNNQLLLKNNCSLYEIKTNPMSNVDLLPWRQSNSCFDNIWTGNISNHVITSGDFETDTKKELFLIRNGNNTSKEKINSTVISSITTQAISNNRTHVVYIGDSVAAGQKELWYVNLLNTILNPIKLTGAIPTTLASTQNLTVRDQGDYAHITAPIDSGFSEVYRINLSTGARTKIHPNSVASFSSHYPSPSYEKLALCGSTSTGIREIRVAGATATSSLSIISGAAIDCNYVTPKFNPSESRIYYQYDKFSVLYFFSANTDASANYNVSSPIGLTKIYYDFGWVDDDWILILASIDNVAKYDLYKVKYDGSQYIKVNANTLTGTGISNVQIFREVNKIIYKASQDNINYKEIYATDITTNVNQKISHDLSSGQIISSYQLSKNKKFILYRVVNVDQSSPKWYKYDFTTQKVELIFSEYINAGDYLGDFIFNNNFDTGILSLRLNYKYYLHSITF